MEPSPNQAPRGHAGQSHGLAAARHGTHSGKARDDAGPVVKGIAAHENEFVGTVGFLHDAGAGDLDFPFVQFARPGRDALEVIRSNHDRIDRHVPQLLHRNRSAVRQNFPTNCQPNDISNYPIALRRATSARAACGALAGGDATTRGAGICRHR